MRWWIRPFMQWLLIRACFQMRNSGGASWHRSLDFLAAFHHGSWAVLGEISDVNLHLLGSLELQIWFLSVTLFLRVVSPMSPGFPRVLSEDLMDSSKGFRLVSGLLTADLVWYWALWHPCWSSEIYEKNTRKTIGKEAVCDLFCSKML